jgi:pimaricinolide synthase PimS1
MQLHANHAGFAAVYEPDGILADHVIAGRSLLPGASMIDLAVAAAQAGPQPCSGLQDVMICRPGLASGALALTVRAGAGSRFTVHAGSDVLCIGKWDTGELPPDTAAATPDLAARGDDIEPRALYAQLERLGYRYGPGLQVMRRVRVLDDGLRFELAGGPHRDGRSGTIDPALLDGAIQAVFCFVQRSANPIAPDALLVPAAVRHVSIHGALVDACSLHLTESALTRAANGITADLRLCDDRGRLLVRVEGLLLRHVPANFLERLPGALAKAS